ncbi:sensor histidine kinase [Labilibacter marinus]|uniref:sensor histidine kinase n=1 Tax=Labilibacter marinus TaxID=1477105 RepID=UPI00094F679D|nr:two-component regulator propeller domain-containing protein [Labilibacter marinus]
MRALVIFCFILVALLTNAQEYDVRISKITDDVGMNIPSTFGIAEDEQGFIWFGTVEGLYRYDGQKVKIYRQSETEPNSLSSQTIRTLLYDSISNIMYIGTQNGGLNILNLETDQFSCFKTSEDHKLSLNNNNVWSLLLDDNGLLWIGMEDNQLAIYDRKSHTLKHIPIITKELLATKGSCTIRMLFQDSNGNVYVGTDRYGIYIFDKNGDRTNISATVINKKETPLSLVLSATEDKNGIVWIATYGNGVLAYNPKEKTFKDHSADIVNKQLISDLIYSVVVNKDEELWVGTEYGISTYLFSKQVSDNFQQNLSKKKSLTDHRIRKLFLDSKGILWIGNEAGVDKLIKRTQFKVYQHDITKTNTLPMGITRSLFKDSDGNIWIGLIDKGMVKYSPKDNKYRTYPYYKNKQGREVAKQISNIRESRFEDYFWIGDWDNGLLQFNPKTGKYTEITNSFKSNISLIDNRIQAIHEDPNGTLWLATENGINRYNPNNQSVQAIKHDPFNDNSVSANSFQSQAFIQDKKGNFWAGTWTGGLNYIEILSEEPLKYKAHRLKDKNSDEWANMNHVISLYQQNDSTLWIGTFGYGLYQYHIKADSLQHYDISSGLWSNIIFGILPGDNNTLWLSTDHGLSEINLQNQNIINYDITDGLQDNHFFWGAAHKAHDGEIIVGGINGFNSFYPKNIKPIKSHFKLHFTEIKIFNEIHKTDKATHLLDTLHLKYNQNFVTLNYALLDYSEPTKNSFRVKLEGLESDWVYVGRQRSVNYSNLKPGKYVFMAQALDSEGYWNKQSRALYILIEKPWWNRYWAIMLFISLILLIVYSIYSFRVRSLEKQKKRLSRMVKERTKEISRKNEELEKTLNKLAEVKGKAVQSEKMASIGMLAAGVAHEINNPINFIHSGVSGFENHLNDNNILVSDESKYYIKVIKEGVSRVVKIVSSLNQFSRTNDSFDEQCDIHEIIDNCLLMLNNLSKEKVDIIKNYHATDILKGNSGKLHQAFLNILSNAVHAIPEKGKIEITTLQNDGKLEVHITDNGVGIEEHIKNRIMEPFFTTKDPGQGTGLGLSLTNQFISEHKGSLSFSSQMNQGTTVIITLPL